MLIVLTSALMTGKSRDISLPTKIRLVKAVFFPVVMYGCESYIIKKAEHRRIDAFKLWCWWRLLRVPWTARRSNQSIQKEIIPEYSLEGLMLKVKFGHLMWRTDSLEKTLMLGKSEGGGEGDDRGWNGGMASPTWWTWVWVSSRSWWWTRKPGVLQSMGLQRVGHDWGTELSWTCVQEPPIVLWKHSLIMCMVCKALEGDAPSLSTTLGHHTEFFFEGDN